MENAVQLVMLLPKNLLLARILHPSTTKMAITRIDRSSICWFPLTKGAAGPIQCISVVRYPLKCDDVGYVSGVGVGVFRRSQRSSLPKIGSALSRGLL